VVMAMLPDDEPFLVCPMMNHPRLPNDETILVCLFRYLPLESIEQLIPVVSCMHVLRGLPLVCHRVGWLAHGCLVGTWLLDWHMVAWLARGCSMCAASRCRLPEPERHPHHQLCPVVLQARSLYHFWGSGGRGCWILFDALLNRRWRATKLCPTRRGGGRGSASPAKTKPRVLLKTKAKNQSDLSTGQPQHISPKLIECPF
jgi:hypothetical protein